MTIDRREFLRLGGMAAGVWWWSSARGWAGARLSALDLLQGNQRGLADWIEQALPPSAQSGNSSAGHTNGAAGQGSSQAAPKNGRPLRVIILGAGLAGLSAGWELTRAGYDVTILEAQTHPGGRVHTIREGLSDDMYAEAGAGRIPNTHRVTLEWVNYFGLSLEQPFFPKELAEVTLLKGKRIITPAGKPMDMSQVPLKLTAEERRVGLSNFDEHYYGAVMRQMGDGIREDWPPDIARLADISMADFLRQQGASDDAIQYMTFGFERDAALDFIRDAYSHHTESLAKIKGGNDQLPRAFAAKLTEQIRYGCAVEQIAQQPNGVRVTYRHAGMQERIDSDVAICAIPFGVLRHIAVTPEWSAAKRNAIDKLSYGPVVRTTFQVNQRYWQAAGLNGFGSSDKNFEVWHPTYGKPGTRGLLQAYVYEDYAHQLDGMAESDVVEHMIADMDAVHPGLRPHLEAVVVKSWANDPSQRVAYCEYYVGEQKLWPDVCARDGRVWFAGEHASPWPGWMQGAIASGMRAAKQVEAASLEPRARVPRSVPSL
jgi:monoamine oxidase